jgi:hypothetical protein
VAGKNYEGSGNGVISQSNGIYFSEADIGNKYFLIFLPDDPNTNSILPYNRPPDTLNCPDKGWPNLPFGKIEFPIP